MYNGDKARKTSLVDYGFRLPCAFDNRPLKFDEFQKRLNQVAVSYTHLDVYKRQPPQRVQAPPHSRRNGPSLHFSASLWYLFLAICL